MNPTAFTLQLALLFFPGIICGIIVEQLSANRKWEPFRFVLYCFVLGLACYLLYALALAAWECKWPTHLFLVRSLGHPSRVSYPDVIWATLMALPIAAFVSLASNRTWLHHAAQKLLVSKKFGDEDVWAFMFNSRDIPEWVIVRDLGLDMAYEGWVQAFAESSADNELLIRDVRVLRDSTREELYKVGALYLARERSRLTIELPGVPITPSAESGGQGEATNGQGKASKAQ